MPRQFQEYQAFPEMPDSLNSLQQIYSVKIQLRSWELLYGLKRSNFSSMSQKNENKLRIVVNLINILSVLPVFFLIFWCQKFQNPKHSFVIFWAKILYKKCVCETLMKVTAGHVYWILAKNQQDYGKGDLTWLRYVSKINIKGSRQSFERNCNKRNCLTCNSN